MRNHGAHRHQARSSITASSTSNAKAARALRASSIAQINAHLRVMKTATSRHGIEKAKHRIEKQRNK